MNVKFSKPIAVQEGDLDQFARAIGHILPHDLKHFFLEFNGAKPEANIFTICENNESSVNALIPLANIVDESRCLDHIGEGIIPIAIAEGGNYVVIDLNEVSAVYFWDHEEPEGRYKLANNIYDFINALKPFDYESVELRDEQVESAWIDPDFLNSLK
jgi:hypothetical protein